MESRPDIVIGIGNDLMGDDAVGLVAARRIGERLNVEVAESNGVGLDVLELVEGHRRVLFLDSIHTGRHPAGTVLSLRVEDLPSVRPLSPHWIGLSDMLQAGRAMGLSIPDTIRILAMEIEDPFHIRVGLSPSMEHAFPAFLRQAESVVSGWLDEKLILKVEHSE